MPTVISPDGTPIAYEQTGSGPAVILVGSALADRSDTRKLAALLAAQFTVINYDRRGRGDSGDTQPYAVEREIEDLDALIRAAGRAASVFGSSSGAVLALRAAAAGLPVERLALFEPPFRLDLDDGALSADYEARLADLLAAGRRGDAVSLFMSRAVGVPRAGLLFMRLWPGLWAKLTAMAPTLLYDHAVMGGTLAGRPLDPAEWAGVSAPTLVMDGGKSAAAFRNAAAALADVLPNARRVTLEGQGHGAVEMAPGRVAPLVREFFVSEPGAIPAVGRTSAHQLRR